jgi:hypothetical protein
MLHAVAMPFHMSLEHNSLGELYCEAFGDASHVHGLGCEHARTEAGCCDPHGHTHDPVDSHSHHDDHFHDADSHWASQKRLSNPLPDVAKSPLIDAPHLLQAPSDRVFVGNFDSPEFFSSGMFPPRAPPPSFYNLELSA